ncbi:MAG TPA: hypothetical protein VGI66_10375 [Streptosporangiaceae bacterium]
MYTRGVSLVTGRVNARAVIPAVLDLVTSGSLRPAEVTDVVAGWDDAIAALTDGPNKVVLHRPAQT